MNGHYNSREWQEYKSGLVDLATATLMEDHLAQCDDCLVIFLALIDEQELNEAAHFVPEDFLDSVLEAVRTRKPASELHRVGIQGRKSRRRQRSNLLVAYASAAAITLFLMSQGFFSGLSSLAAASSPPLDSNQAGQQLVESEQKVLDEYLSRLDNANQRLIDAFRLPNDKGGN